MAKLENFQNQNVYLPQSLTLPLHLFICLIDKWVTHENDNCYRHFLDGKNRLDLLLKDYQGGRNIRNDPFLIFC